MHIAIFVKILFENAIYNNLAHDPGQRQTLQFQKLFIIFLKTVLELRFRLHNFFQFLWKMPFETEFMKCVELRQFISPFRS